MLSAVSGLVSSQRHSLTLYFSSDLGLSHFFAQDPRTVHFVSTLQALYQRHGCHACKTVEIAHVRILGGVWPGLGLPHGRPVYSCTTFAWLSGMWGRTSVRSANPDRSNTALLEATMLSTVFHSVFAGPDAAISCSTCKSNHSDLPTHRVRLIQVV